MPTIVLPNITITPARITTFSAKNPTNFSNPKVSFTKLKISFVKSANVAPNLSYAVGSTASAIAPNFCSPCSKMAFINACLLSACDKAPAVLPTCAA